VADDVLLRTELDVNELQQQQHAQDGRAAAKQADGRRL
jgi:hypothetical protein